MPGCSSTGTEANLKLAKASGATCWPKVSKVRNGPPKKGETLGKYDSSTVSKVSVAKSERSPVRSSPVVEALNNENEIGWKPKGSGANPAGRIVSTAPMTKSSSWVNPPGKVANNRE